MNEKKVKALRRLLRQSGVDYRDRGAGYVQQTPRLGQRPGGWMNHPDSGRGTYRGLKLMMGRLHV